MHRRLRLFLSLLLTVCVVIGPALPATAETGMASGTAAAVAAHAKSSIVGILTTTKAERSTQKGHAAGTGFVYKDGVIITNAHVVADASEVMILYSNQTVEDVAPDQISADATADIAVIRVKAKGLVPLPFADSDTLMVGMPVVAIGNPLGFRLSTTVTAGILSGMGRAVGSAYPFLQLDAPINPGNSGGPLFNLNGEVIGINSSKISEEGVDGLGFAIPSNTARQIADQLLRDGKVDRATLGMELNEGWQAYFGVPDEEGVTIAYKIDDGPVGLTALQPGDALVSLDDKLIYTSDDYYAFLASHKPGDWVTITVRRSGQLLSVRVKLASEDALRKLAEEQGQQEVTGILLNLTAGQIQEAAEYGRSLSQGSAYLNRNYVASSGGDYAILYTEYLYIARRLASAYDFGFRPSMGFQQAAAKEIRGQVEIQFEMEGEKDGFLQGATYTLEQDGKKVDGTVQGAIAYTMSPKGDVAIADGAIRFPTTGLHPAKDLTVTIKLATGKTAVFRFTIKDLR
ncbi:MAG: S1C family serine protease [Mycobacterium leprae]